MTYDVIIDHPTTGSTVTVRTVPAVAIDSEYGKMADGSVFQGEIINQADGSIWFQITQTAKYPAYIGKYVCLRNAAGKIFGTWKAVNDVPPADVTLRYTIQVYSDGSLVINGTPYA